jgi:hypothetical protein
MLVPPSHPPHVTRCIDARLVWMGNQPLNLRRQYLIKHTTQIVKAQVRRIRYRADINTFEKHPATELKLNEIGAVIIDTHAPLFVDQYGRNRATGSFILVDPIANATVAAGMVTGRDARIDSGAEEKDTDPAEAGRVPIQERQARIGHPPVLVWLNGGAHVAYAVERELFQRGYLTHVIAAQTDGSMLLEIAHNVIAAGMVAICSADFLYEVEKERAEALTDAEHYVNIDASRLDSPEQAAAAVAEELRKRRIVPRRTRRS